MNIKRFFGVCALLCVFALNFSCETETASESDELYGIGRKEIKEQDT